MNKWLHLVKAQKEKTKTKTKTKASSSPEQGNSTKASVHMFNGFNFLSLPWFGGYQGNAAWWWLVLLYGTDPTVTHLETPGQAVPRFVTCGQGWEFFWKDHPTSLSSSPPRWPNWHKEFWMCSWNAPRSIVTVCWRKLIECWVWKEIAVTIIMHIPSNWRGRMSVWFFCLFSAKEQLFSSQVNLAVIRQRFYRGNLLIQGHCNRRPKSATCFSRCWRSHGGCP